MKKRLDLRTCEFYQYCETRYAYFHRFIENPNPKFEADTKAQAIVEYPDVTVAIVNLYNFKFTDIKND